jgi:hypothetical protein
MRDGRNLIVQTIRLGISIELGAVARMESNRDSSHIVFTSLSFQSQNRVVRMERNRLPFSPEISLKLAY